MKTCRISFTCLVVASLLCACRTISPRAGRQVGRYLYRELDGYFRWNYEYPKSNFEFQAWLEAKRNTALSCGGGASEYEQLLRFLNKYEIELVGDSNQLVLSSDRYRYRETLEYHIEDDFADMELRPRYPVLGISDEGEQIYIAGEDRRFFYRQIEQAVGEVPACRPTTYTIIRYCKGVGMQNFLRTRSFQDSASHRVSQFLHDFCNQRNLRQLTFPICLWPEETNVQQGDITTTPNLKK